MTTKTEKLANNYVWKNEYDKEYKDNYSKIDWSVKSSEWEEVKDENGKTTYKLKASYRER